MLAIFEALLSFRDCYRLVTSVLAVADVFGVFKKIRPNAPQDSISVTHFDAEIGVFDLGHTQSPSCFDC